VNVLSSESEGRAKHNLKENTKGKKVKLSLCSTN
jgi:hypothetical protein